MEQNTQTSASRSLLTLEQVERILHTRKFIDHSLIGMEITQGLRIVGRGNPTKDGKRMVYNTNAMRKDAVVQAKALLRDAKAALSIGDQDTLQSALQQALNVGVITFSLNADWTQFVAGSSIHARVDSFTIQDGPDAGKTGIGISGVRPAPTVALASDADIWAEDDATASSVPSAEITAASQLG